MRSNPRDRSRRSRSREVAIAAPIFAAVVAAPMLMGGALFWTRLAIIAVFGGIALALGIRAYRKGHRGALGPAGVAVIGAAAWTLAQALPWPRVVTSALAPDAVRNLDDANRLLGRASAEWIAVSMAPQETQEDLLLAFGVAAAFCAGALASVMGARRWVLRGVAISATVAAVVFLGHMATDAQAVFGIYVPVHAARSPVAGPLLNPNHLGGLLSLGAPIALGVALDGSSRERPSWLVAVVLLAGATIVTMSRGALVSLLAGLALMAVVVAVRRARLRDDRGASIIVASTAAVGGVALGLYVAFERWAAALPHEGFDKLEIALRGLELALTGPAVGYGRGAFSVAFVAMHGTNARFEHPENLLAQWTSEWGLLVGVALIVAFATAWLRAARDARSFTRLGALCGVAAVVIHDQVDFACEMPGLATVVASAFGAATASPRAAHAGALVPATITIGVAALLGAAALGPLLVTRTLDHARAAITERLRAGDLDGATAEADRAIAVHPGEPSLALYRAHLSVARGRPDAGAWLNAAMRRAPEWHAPHTLAARWLIGRRAVAQALLEIREAERLRVGSAGPLLCELVRADVSATDIARAAPLASRDEFLDRAARCVALTSPFAVALDDALGDAAILGPHLRAARRALASGELDDAAIALARAGEIDPTSEAVVLLESELAARRGEPADAIGVLERAIARRGTSSALLVALAEQHAASGDVEAMRSTVTQLRGRAAGATAAIARSLLLLARLEISLGNPRHAFRAYEEAHRIDPESGALSLLARAAERSGERTRALAAYNELCARAPGSADCAARDRLRSGLRQPMIPRP